MDHDVLIQIPGSEDELEVWAAHEDYDLRNQKWTGEVLIKNQIKANPIWLTKRNKINAAWREYMRVKAMLDSLGLRYGVLEGMNDDSTMKHTYTRPSILSKADKIVRPKIKGIRIPKPAKRRFKATKGKE